MIYEKLRWLNHSVLLIFKIIADIFMNLPDM